MIPFFQSKKVVAAVVAAALVVVAALIVLPRGQSGRKVAAEFPSAVGLYAGNEVRMRGVKVGTIDSVKQKTDHVEVTMTVEKSQPIPADVQAVIVAQTLVTGRYVQLTQYSGSGPTLPPGKAITDTHVPVEWDQVLSQLDKVTKALGPQGANAHGALSNLITTGSKNLSGQGANLNTTIAKLSAALTTLSNGRGDLFATLDNLDSFVTTLDESDSQVATFNTQLDGAANLLASNRTQLAAVFSTLDSSFANIEQFLAANRTHLTGDLQELEQVASTLSGQRQHLADLLQVAPAALSDFQNIYDPVSGGLTGVIAPLNGNGPAATLCGLIGGFTDSTGSGCADALDQILQPAGATSPVQLSSLVPTIATFERDGACNQVTAVPGPATTPVATRTCTSSGSSSTASSSSTTGLGGLLAPGSGR